MSIPLAIHFPFIDFSPWTDFEMFQSCNEPLLHSHQDRAGWRTI